MVREFLRKLNEIGHESADVILKGWGFVPVGDDIRMEACGHVAPCDECFDSYTEIEDEQEAAEECGEYEELGFEDSMCLKYPLLDRDQGFNAIDPDYDAGYDHFDQGW